MDKSSSPKKDSYLAKMHQVNIVRLYKTEGSPIEYQTPETESLGGFGFLLVLKSNCG